MVSADARRLMWPMPRTAIAGSILVFAVTAQSLVALLQQFVDGQRLQFVQLVEQYGFQADRHRARIAVRAAGGFADDLVDQAEFPETWCGQAQRFGGILGAPGVLPQDRRATFRRDHGIGGVLQHVDAVAHADRQGAARAAFAGHGAYDRHFQFSHFLEVARDRLALAALLGADARISAGGVDEGEHGQAEAFGHLHQAQRLAVAFRTRHAEVAADLRLDVAALLVTDHHHRPPDHAREAADDRRVVGIHAIARELVEFIANHGQVVAGVGAPRMPRQLRDLPWRQVAE